MKKNKKRYLIENDLVVGGGAEQIMRLLVSKLLAEGHDVTVATCSGSKKMFYDNYPREVKHFLWEVPWCGNVRRFSLAWMRYRVRRMQVAMQRWILDHRRYDVAIAMKEGPCMRDVANRNVRKRYGWVHVDYRSLYWTKGTYSSAEEEMAFFRKMDNVICVSQAAADGVKLVVGDPGNLLVAHNPIDIDAIKAKSYYPCEVMRMEGKPLLVAVGRLVEGKRFDLLLEACACLSGRYDFEVWIVGEGDQRDALERMIAEAHFDFVKLLGHKDNPYPYIKQADWFVSTSVSESYGLAIQEALILGVPVVVTECPAMYETVEEKYGYIIDNNVEALVVTLEEILTNHAFALAKRAGAQEYSDKFESLSVRLNRIYQIVNS